MPRSAGHIVAHLCGAQAKLREAAELVARARLQTVDLSGAHKAGDFRGTPLERGLDKIGADIHEQAEGLDNEIRALAELIGG